MRSPMRWPRSRRQRRRNRDNYMKQSLRKRNFLRRRVPERELSLPASAGDNMEVDIMSMMGVGSAGASTAVVRGRDGKIAGRMTYRKPESAKKKRLTYSFKRISAQILASKTPGVARRVVIRARHEVVSLLRKKASGQYDQEELRHAILHAERMVRVAKKRTRHLEEEQDAKKKGGICEAEIEEKTEEKASEEERLLEDLGGEEIISQEEMKQLIQELQDAMEELENEMPELEELAPVAVEEMDPEDLELLKKKHRAQELRDIMEADMKYLKAMFGKLERDRQESLESVKAIDSGQSNGPSNGVSLELGGVVVAAQGQETQLTQITVMTEGGSFDISV